MKIEINGRQQYLSTAGNLDIYNGSLLLLFLPFLPFLSGGVAVKWLGYVGLLVVFLVLAAANFRRQRRGEFGAAHWAFLSLLPIGVIGLSALEVQAFVQILQISILSLIIRQAPSLSYTNLAAKFSFGLCLALSVFFLVDLVYGLNLLSGNPNLYGVAAFCWVAIMIKCHSASSIHISHLRILGISAIPFVVAFASGSRASLFAIAIMVAWIELGRLPVVRWFRWLGALLVICAPIVLLLNINSDVISAAMELTPSVGEKHTLSGRDAIWSYIYASVSANDFMGFGLGSTPGDLQNGVNDGLSAHNGFFQIFYQFGALGFFVYIFVYAFLIKKMHARRDDGVSVSILLGAIILEMFEVVMTQNHFGAGLSLWSVATLGIFSINRSEKN